MAWENLTTGQWASLAWGIEAGRLMQAVVTVLPLLKAEAPDVAEGLWARWQGVARGRNLDAWQLAGALELAREMDDPSLPKYLEQARALSGSPSIQ